MLFLRAMMPCPLFGARASPLESYCAHSYTSPIEQKYLSFVLNELTQRLETGIGCEI